MGQQPNIELDEGDAPRTELEPPPPHRWVNNRPGAINSPEEQPWGGEFGRPGPDAGWALRLIDRAEFDRSERGPEIEAVLAALVAARASYFGRAPVPEDVEVGLTLLGLRLDGFEPGVIAALSERRQHALDHAAHEHTKGSSLLREIPIEHLTAPIARLRSLLK